MGSELLMGPENDQGYTALEAAAQVHSRNSSNSSLAILKMLLLKEASPNRSDGSAGQLLASLITGGHCEYLKLALNAGARPEGIARINVGDGTSFYGTPLQVAAYFNDLNAVKELLKHGAAINTPAHHVRGYTALQAVCAMNERPNQPDNQVKRFQKQVDLFDLLVSHGADVNAPAGEKFGRTALQAVACVEEPNFMVIQKLLVQHADFNGAPARVGGVTALQGAAIRGNLHLARMLLNLGADLNADAALEQGRTAVEGAAEYGRMEMLKLLLHNGVHSEPLTGFSAAIKLASENGHWHIMDFLNGLHLGL